MADTRRAARLRQATRLRPYTDQTAVLRAVALTIMSMTRRRRREIWIGDSHAAAFLVGPTWAIFLAGPRGELVLRVGARLMYSLARHGFPRKVRWFADAIRWFGRRDSFVPVFVAGEIDVRNALAARPSDFAFVDEYVAQVRAIASRMKASSAYVLVPPPPTPRAAIEPSFPSVGTDEERLAAFAGLRAALASATQNLPDVVLVDLTETLADPSGWLRPDLTDDGCHVNAVAHPAVRAALNRHPDFATGQR